jgi:putative hydrolase of the HAD superfamily
VLLDLDDTLLETEQAFQNTFAQITGRVAQYVPDRSPQDIRATIAEVNEASFVALGANIRMRAPMIARGVCEAHQIRAPELETEISALVDGIYDLPPVLKPHALEVMQTLCAINIPRACVTHANEEWTMFKLRASGLQDAFTRIVIVDENTKKSAQSWRGACLELGVSPEDSLIIGDSLRSDIRPARDLGVKHVAWLNDGQGWQHNSVGAVPEGVNEFRSLSQLLAWLCGSPPVDG